MAQAQGPASPAEVAGSADGSQQGTPEGRRWWTAGDVGPARATTVPRVLGPATG